MATRIGALVEYGELINLRDYSTLGLLKLKGREDPIRLELTGNAGPDLMGWHIRFEPRPPEEVTWWEPEPEEGLAEKLASQQIGPTGTMTAASKVKVTKCPPTELYMRCKAGEPPPFEWKPRLYLEWFSQNGRVVIEMADPVIDRVEFVDLGGEPVDKTQSPEDEEEPDLSRGPGITLVQLHEDGDVEVTEGAAADFLEEQEADDRYGLFPDDLQRKLDRQAREADKATWSDGDKTIREAELMDDLIDHSDGEPLISFLHSPKAYGPPDQLDDEEVEGALKGLLGELALYGIALHVCQHFTPRDAYRLLLDDLLPNARAHPELRGTGWVTGFMTHEHCAQCEADALREYEEHEADRQGEGSPDEEGT